MREAGSDLVCLDAAKRFQRSSLTSSGIAIPSSLAGALARSFARPGSARGDRREGSPHHRNEGRPAPNAGCRPRRENGYAWPAQFETEMAGRERPRRELCVRYNPMTRVGPYLSLAAFQRCPLCAPKSVIDLATAAAQKADIREAGHVGFALAVAERGPSSSAHTPGLLRLDESLQAPAPTSGNEANLGL